MLYFYPYSEYHRYDYILPDDFFSVQEQIIRF